MLGVVINEKEIVNKVINENKLLINNQSKIVKLLIKYYYEGGETDELNIKENIFNIMIKCDNEFTRPKWDDYLNKQIHKYIKDKKRYNDENKLELIEVDNVVITENEINSIDNIKDKKLKKIMFIMLVYVKINNKLYNNNSEWISYPIGNIFKEAKVIANSTEKVKILHELSNLGLIENNYFNNKKVSIKIKYIYNSSKTVLTLNDFEGVIHYYLNYEGEHWKKCSECGKWFKSKSKTYKPKYCNKCAKEIKNEQNKRYYKENNDI